MPYAIDFNRGFWYGTLPCTFMFEGAKLLAASMSTVEWCKSCAHISFLFEILMYVPTQHEQSMGIYSASWLMDVHTCTVYIHVHVHEVNFSVRDHIACKRALSLVFLAVYHIHVFCIDRCKIASLLLQPPRGVVHVHVYAC